MSAGRSADALGLDVNIMGREYRIACKPEEKQELLDAVAYVDGQMREIRDAAKQNNAERVAVMAALNVAHELLRARAGAVTATAPASAADHVDLTGFQRRIQTMQSTIDAALSEQERLL
jgi:cell division protein ZapA